MTWSRRQLLLGAAACLTLPARSLAFSGSTRVDVGELDLSGAVRRPDAWRRLLYEVEVVSSVECVHQAVPVSPDSPDLFAHPFTTLVGSEDFEIPGDAGIEQLRRFLDYGGLLYIDETSGAEGSGFDDSVRALLERVYPTRSLAPIPSDHSVYRSFFIVRRPLGRLDRFPYLEGITVGNLAPVLYGRNDLSGALERGSDGVNVAACVPGGERQRREAVKLGVNLVLYSLTANYKRDQAHVRELMREGKLE